MVESKHLIQKFMDQFYSTEKNNEHLKEFKKLNFPKIDLVIVNLYPFSKFKIQMM